MPEISNLHIIRVTVEKFLDNCSASELHELELLLQRPKYQAMMYPDVDVKIAAIVPIGTRICPVCGEPVGTDSRFGICNIHQD